MRGFVGEGRAIDIKWTVEISTISRVTNGRIYEKGPNRGIPGPNITVDDLQRVRVYWLLSLNGIFIPRYFDRPNREAIFL